jgi:hypothetical protein
MGSFRRGGRRTRTIPSIFASCFVVLAGNAALATTEPPETQEVAYYVTNELFLFVCWKIQDQCTAYAQADHHGTANACPHLLSERSLNTMIAFLLRETARRSGAAFAALEDCHAGLGYWQGRFCIDLSPYAPGDSFKWCSYATEVPEMRLSKDGLRRLLQSQREP